MRTISIIINNELHAWIAAQARRTGRGKSAIVRDALERARANYAHSCHALMMDACGSIRSGVKDLATNKRHLRRYGGWLPSQS